MRISRRLTEIKMFGDEGDGVDFWFYVGCMGCILFISLCALFGLIAYTITATVGILYALVGG